MAIIKYHDGNQNLVPLGATGDHSHSLDSLGAAEKGHGHKVVSTEADGFMSTEDKETIDQLNTVVFGNTTDNIDGLVKLVGDTSVETQIETAVEDCINNLSIDGTKISYTTAGGDTGSINTQDTQYSVMLPASENDDGKSGLVPTPEAGKQDQFLKGDGTWAIPTNTEYSAGAGISLDGNEFSNSGVLFVKEGAKDGTVQVNTNGVLNNVPVHGLGTAAYTSADDYDKAKAAETALADANKYTDEKFAKLVGDTNVETQIETAVNDCITGLSVNGRTITYTQAGGSTGTIITQDSDTTKFTITASAEDDGIVDLTGTNGTNQVTYKASHAKKGPSNGYTSDNTTTSISGFGGSGTIKIPQITVDTYGHVTAASDESVTISIPNKPAVTNSVTSGSTDAVSSGAVYSAIKTVSDMVGDTKVEAQIDDALKSLKYALSSSAGGAATSANKVNNSLTIKLNSGTTEGSNKFTFDGANEKTVNITPSSIGAASSSHGNHVPTVETANNAKFLRNDNTWQTVTPANIGAASTSTFDTSANGLVPYPGSSNTGKYLRGDGTWQTPYTHPTGSGNNHIPSGGSSGQYLKYSSAGTATWADPPSTSVSTFNGYNSGLVPKPSVIDAKTFLDSSGSWCAPQAFQPSTNTGKRYLTGTENLNSISFINTNDKCYMDGGHLYSNGNQVLTQGSVQSGTNTISVPANDKNFKGLTFSTSYSSAPIVVAAISSNVDASKVGVTVNSVDTNGFTAMIWNGTGNTLSVDFNWIAVGV